LRPLVYILRFFLVIRFYDDLLEDINRAYRTDLDAFELGQALDEASKLREQHEAAQASEINELTYYAHLLFSRGRGTAGR